MAFLPLPDQDNYSILFKKLPPLPDRYLLEQKKEMEAASHLY
jgi:hypothetical protein